MADDLEIPRTLESPKPDQVTELFPYELPFKASQTTGLIIIALFTAVVLGAVLVDLPETVRAPFALTPETGTDPIQSPFGGILAAAPVEEGSRVREGDVLFAIRSRQVQDWRTEYVQLDEDLIELMDRQEASESLHETRLAVLASEVRRLESELGYHENYRDRYKEVLDKMTQLNRSGVVSPVEVLGYELGLAEAERDVAGARLAVERARLDRQILETERNAEKVGERIQRNKIEVRLDALDELLKNAERDVVYFHAPYDGVVLSVAVQRIGDVVELGQELCQIARVDSRPRARLSVGQEGLPRMDVGQPVKLYFQAFPYQRYGTVGGTVAWISPAAVLTPQGREFVAFVNLDQYTIPAGGELAPLLVGMGGEARIAVGKRTLIEYAFEPLRQLRENFSQRQETMERGGGASPAPDETVMGNVQGEV